MMKFTISSLGVLTVLGTLLSTAQPVSAQGKTTKSTSATPEKLVAEAPIWGPNNAFDGYAYLPVAVQGHAGTLVIDLNCTECDVKLGADGLQAAGIPAVDPNATSLDSMTIGPLVERKVPIGMYPSLGAVPTPPNVAPVIGSVGVNFLTTRYDILYDFPNKIVRLYAPSATPVTAATAWYPDGFTSANCGEMVTIPTDPPGAQTFTGMHITLDGHPAIGAIEMGPYYIKMNQAAFAALGVPDSSSRLTPVTDDQSVAPGTRYVTGVQTALKGVSFDMGKIQIFQEVGIQQAFPPNTPVLLMNLSTLRSLRLFNSRSSHQVCLALKS